MRTNVFVLGGLHHRQTILRQPLLRHHGGGQCGSGGVCNDFALQIFGLRDLAVLADNEDALEVIAVARFSQDVIAPVQCFQGLIGVWQYEFGLARLQFGFVMRVAVGGFHFEHHAGHPPVEVIHERGVHRKEFLRVVQRVNGKPVDRIRAGNAWLDVVLRAFCRWRRRLAAAQQGSTGQHGRNDQLFHAVSSIACCMALSNSSRRIGFTT